MKFSTLEEYGLRCLLFLSRKGPDGIVTIPELSEAENMSQPNVAKVMRTLREGKFIRSVRGHSGGYQLTEVPKNIRIGDVMSCLGGKLYDIDFCQRFVPFHTLCTHSTACSLKSLWGRIQRAVDQVVMNLTLADLLGNADASPQPLPSRAPELASENEIALR